MSSPKSSWEALYAFGRLGVVALLLLLLLLWAVVHWQAEPGTEVQFGFGFISYTKPASAQSKVARAAEQLRTSLARLNISVEFISACETVDFVDSKGERARTGPFYADLWVNTLNGLLRIDYSTGENVLLRGAADEALSNAEVYNRWAELREACD